MPVRWISGLRSHAHVLLIVPLVVIVMTWPTFALIFDWDELSFHTGHLDLWLRIWDAWHIERVLSGQAQLFYTADMFHPNGVSLIWQQFSVPHALLFIVFHKFMPADSAYNLLFLLILCFNAFCTYPLIRHLTNDKWIALYGATVVGVSVPYLFGSTVPDLIMIGTIPLTIYFVYRAFTESRWRFAALAGVCAGVTAFIGVYNFVFILMTVGILAICQSASRWKQTNFWRSLALFMLVCASISAFRFYPMIADASLFKEGIDTYRDSVRSNDALDCCVVTGNPFTGELFRRALALQPDGAGDRAGLKFNEAYLAYINIFFMCCAFLHKPLRRKLAPWLAILLCFAILRLGHFLTIKGIEYRNILLPEYFLTEWFPALFVNINTQEYYQFGVVVPLAILASYGLARLIKSLPTQARIPVVLIAILILAIEYYGPFSAKILEREKIAYNDWLATEPDSAIKLINLPMGRWSSQYFIGLQTFNSYPTAFGFMHRNPTSTHTYVKSNALLNAWDDRRSPHCLPYNEQTFLAALDKLLADGFTHVVVHNWLYGDQFINHSFWNVPKSYDNGFVSVYRLRDLRFSCEHSELTLPRFDHFSGSPRPPQFPGRRSSILSFHPSEAIDKDLFAYLASLYSEWHSLIHLYLDDGELVTQSAGKSYPAMDAFARDNQVIYLLYNNHDVDETALRAIISFEKFNLCQHEEHEDGSVIQHYVSREFTCALLASSQPFQADYDNGAQLENALFEVHQDLFDIQLMWSNLPDEPHSVSLQVFDDAGAKVLGQDSTIGHVSLARRRLDISSLPPGEYQVKLIVYSYETGNSVAGTVSGTGITFERELTITTLDRR